MRSVLTELLRKPAEWGARHTLWVHDDNVSTHELVLNPELFPTVKGYVALVHPTTGRRAYLAVSSTERGPFKQNIAECFDFESRGDVFVRVLTPEEVPEAAYVIVRFREQYIGRLPMRQIRDYLRGGGAYVGKHLVLPNACVRARIDALYDSSQQPISSGIVSAENVAVTFLSETAKVTILVQIAKESLEWDPMTGQTFLEKSIDGFLADLFTRWKEENVNHIVSILLYARIIQDNEPRDLYSVAVQWESHADWRLKLKDIRKEAQLLVEKAEEGEMVPAKDGNFLEAIHFALMIYDKHFLDRDLSKTGISIISITPGNGHFVIDDEHSYTLCKLAKRKVVDDGIWLQIVCLSNPPLYATPLLEIVKRQDRILQNYYRPYWMTCSYFAGKSQWNQEDGESCHVPNTLRLHSENSHANTAKFYRCRAKSPPDASLVSLLSLDDTTQWDQSQRYNPCDPTTTNVRHCQICSVKWSCLMGISPVNTDDLDHSLPHWPTLVFPPCLPLKSKCTVTRKLLAEEFNVSLDYRVTLAKETLFLQESHNLTDLRNELIALRIALGMQETVGELDETALVYGHEIHIIETVEETIRVQIFTRRGHTTPAAVVPYSAYIRPKLHNAYSYRQLAFSPSNNKDYPWELVDKMISGNGEREVAEGHSWQSRFILIPAEEAPRSSLIMATAANEILDDEELRIAGFLKFVEMFQRCILSRPTPSSAGKFEFQSPKLRQSTIDELGIMLTTSTCSSYAHQEAKKIEMIRPELFLGNPSVPDSVIDVEPLSISSPVERVAVMMQHPLVGMGIRNQRWHWRMYKSVFVGSAAVDWILKFFEDITSREAAVEYGNRLIDEGVWEHILGAHRFLDGYYYYRFSPAYDIATLRKSNPMVLKTISSREQLIGEGYKDVLHPIIMSRTAVIDVDSQKRSADKREWAFLHYDSTHNPKNTFHFRLHWLTCSARLVDDLIQAWARRAFQCGFIMLEAPVEIPGSLHSLPFHAPLPIEFSVPPPRVGELNRILGSAVNFSPTFFIEELLRIHGFVLDFESDSTLPIPASDHSKWQLLWSYGREEHCLMQYVHRSGVAIVQIDGDGLLWTSNRLLLASTASRTVRPTQSSQFFALESEIRKQLLAFCSDPEVLGNFWQSTLNQLGQKVGIETILDNIPDDMTEGADGVIGSPENIFDRILAIDDLLSRTI